MDIHGVIKMLSRFLGLVSAVPKYFWRMSILLAVYLYKFRIYYLRISSVETSTDMSLNANVVFVSNMYAKCRMTLRHLENAPNYLTVRHG